MTIKAKPEEDRTGEVWRVDVYGAGVYATFLVIGAPTILPETRWLEHPVISLDSGGRFVRRETSRSAWLRNYERVL